MTAPKVSVIVPNYNHARYLPRRIDSILEQTFQDFELILLDDCSTDASREVLRAYADKRPNVRLAFNERNTGSSFVQWNRGVSLAQGQYVWIAESDDDAEPVLLARLVALLEAHPNVGLAYCRSRLVDSEGRPNGKFLPGGNPRWERDFVAPGRREVERELSLGCTIPNASAVLFRREVFQRAGGACQGLRLMGDWRTWIGLLLLADVAYVAEPLNRFRLHRANVRTAMKDQWWQEHRRLIDEVAKLPGVPLRPFEIGYHTSQAHRFLGERQWPQARRAALAALRLAPLKPYCWRLLLRSLLRR